MSAAMQSEDVLCKTPSKEIEIFEDRHEQLRLVAGMSPEERKKVERKLLWKLDARFVLLVLLYVINYIDRSNMSSARTKGMEADLGISDAQFDVLLSILYVGYISLQIPSNMFIQYSGRPSLFLPACIFIWGGISAATGAVKSFAPAVVIRLLLGVAECPFFAGALLMLSSWYTKRELGKRITLLYCGSLVSNAFGPLIAAGILGTMEGKAGVRAWQWLFYIEGSLTMFMAIVAMLVLPDFPHNSRHFSKTELELAQLRMTEDAGTADETTVSSWTAFKLAMCDIKLWTMSLLLLIMVIGLSCKSFFSLRLMSARALLTPPFLPLSQPVLLTKTLGYDNTTSLLLCAPPFAFAALTAFMVSRDSDKRQERFLHIVVPLLFGVVGFIIAMTTHSFAPRYISLFLMAGSYSGFVVFYAWVASTFARPAMTRGVAIAAVNAISQLGNIIGAYIFPAHWGPSYRNSYAICISCFAVTIAIAYLHRWNLTRLNRKLARRDEAEQTHGNAEAENDAHLAAFPVGFRYVL
ncbi:hypothetical protein JCM8202_001124 [Rhodotorula sphaerocarpa]